jgi:hypothetical protein
VVGYLAVVQNLSKNLKGLEAEYIDCAGRETVTLGLLGPELCVSKTIVSLDSVFCGRRKYLDLDTESQNSLGIDYEAFHALIDQFETKVIFSSRSLYFRPGRGEEVMGHIGSSP